MGLGLGLGLLRVIYRVRVRNLAADGTVFHLVHLSILSVELGKAEEAVGVHIEAAEERARPVR